MKPQIVNAVEYFLFDFYKLDMETAETLDMETAETGFLNVDVVN